RLTDTARGHGSGPTATLDVAPSIPSDVRTPGGDGASGPGGTVPEDDGVAPWDDAISQSEFDSLPYGISAGDADRFVGAAGTVVEQSGAPGSAEHEVVVRWEGKASGTFA